MQTSSGGDPQTRRVGPHAPPQHVVSTASSDHDEDAVGGEAHPGDAGEADSVRQQLLDEHQG